MLVTLPDSENSIIISNMAIAWPMAQVEPAMRDHGFHHLRIAHILRETAEASSFVLKVPPELERVFVYEAGQFCTFRFRIDGRPYLRCYSMSSSPATDADLQVMVKRVPSGLVSNWMLDNLTPGDLIETTYPAGVFCLRPFDGDVVAFAAGSGITPVLSVVKTALATTSRGARLLYANRDEDSIIFAAEVDRLADRYAGRFEVVHHLDTDHGFIEPDTVAAFAGTAPDSEYFVCGPGPFMDIIERTLLDHGVDDPRIHIERFSPQEPAPESESAIVAPTKSRVTIELGGRTDTVDHHPGTTILQAARQMAMAPPFSCESGSCATCMAKVIEGDVVMHVNNALTDDEVADGWVLTCQAVPATPSVRVVYEEA